jgi:branched-chain amino acid transport system substrate-binding protein
VKGLILASLAGALIGCAPGGDSYAIATAGPWDEGYGRMNKRGVDLAIEEINKRGGIRGSPLRLLERNDGGDGSRAVTIAGELVANEDVIAVVGHVNSGAMVAAARVYDGKLAAISTTASSPDISGLSSWVFRVISSDSVNGMDMARFAGSLGRRRAAILYENNSYGRGLTESFRRNFKGEIVTVDPLSADGTNFEPYISYLRTRAPDIVFVAGTEASGIRILREARRQRLAADFIGGDGWSGVASDTAAAEGAYVAMPFSARDPRGAAQRFVATYRARYGQDPDANAALAYDATNLVALAISKAGRNRKAVRDYLASLGASNAYEGVTGSIYFRDTGDVVGKGFVMTRVQRGALLVQRDRGE